MTADNALDIAIDLGKGDKAATGVASVIWNGTRNLLATGQATYSNGKIILTSQTVNYYIQNPDQPRTIIVNFDDAAKTAVTITLTAD